MLDSFEGSLLENDVCRVTAENVTARILWSPKIYRVTFRFNWKVSWRYTVANHEDLSQENVETRNQQLNEVIREGKEEKITTGKILK